MSRPARYTHEDVLDAALAVVGRQGRAGVSIQRIADQLGAPTGSLYHRFDTRDELLVALWTRSVRRFQRGFLDAIGDPDLGTALRTGALHLPRYCRDHPAEAQALTLFRYEALLAHKSGAVRSLVSGLNDEAYRAMRDLCGRRFGAVTPDLFHILDAAMRTVGYGLLRPVLAAREAVPTWIDEVIIAAQPAILAVGDARG